MANSQKPPNPRQAKTDTTQPQRIEDLMEGLKNIAPKQANDLLASTIQERRRNLAAQYPANQEFREFQLEPGAGNKSYLALMAGPGGKQVPVVFTEGKTNADMLAWTVDKLTHGQPVRFNLAWDFQFNEDSTEVTKAEVTRMSITTKEQTGPASLDIPMQNRTKVLYDSKGNLQEVLSEPFKENNPNYRYSEHSDHSDYSCGSPCE